MKLKRLIDAESLKDRLFKDEDCVMITPKDIDMEPSYAEKEAKWLYSAMKKPPVFRICGNCGAGYKTEISNSWRGCPMCLSRMNG